MRLFKRAIKIYDEEGFRSLIKRTQAFLRNRLIKPVVDFYWNIRGTQSFSIGGTTVTFESTTESGGDVIRWLYDIEKDIISDIVNELRTDDVFYDVGANLGIFSCFAVQVINERKVIVFEPYPSNTTQLSKNLELNQSEDRAEVWEVALTDSKENVEYEVPHSQEVGIGTTGIATGSKNETIKVSGLPGDKLINEGKIPEPDAVKIDVEGSEANVIEGMRETLSGGACRLLYCEIHRPSSERPSIDDYGSTVEDLIQKKKNLVLKSNSKRSVQIKAERVR